MFLMLFLMSFLLTSSHGLGNEYADKFMTDLLNSWDVDRCDLDYVFDGKVPKISPETISTFNER